jgi:predicted RNA binding protein YcfA (HicA-like mRNA interferase family)
MVDDSSAPVGRCLSISFFYSRELLYSPRAMALVDTFITRLACTVQEPRTTPDSTVAIPKPPFVTFGPADSINDVRVRAMKVRNVVKLIEDDGWRLARTRGSHRQYKHPDKPGLVTIAGKPGDDLAPGTLGSILKQAGLTKK